MLRKLIPLVAILVFPAVVAAQAPQKHGATQVRGEPVGLDHRPVTPATPAIPATRATPAVPSHGNGPATPAVPAKPATPAVPASPSQKPASPGNSASHRP